MRNSSNDPRNRRRTSPSSTTTTTSSLLYHEDSPLLVLRPTAPACAWRRLKTSHNNYTTSSSKDPATRSASAVPVQEISLIGWSYPAILERVLPLFHQASSSSSSSSSSVSSKEEDDRDDQNNNNALQSLRVLHIVSTELWVSSEFRSPFSLGADRVSAALLSQPCCRNLDTLCLSRACNKSPEDWALFCRALATSVPKLRHLELCDTADLMYHSGTRNRTLSSPRTTTTTTTNASLLFQALADANLESLQGLKLHLNAYQPGRLSLSAWRAFVRRYHNQLQELSLHMIQVRGSSGSKVENKEPTVSSFSRLHVLHVTFVDFDSNYTCQHVLWKGLLSPRSIQHLHTLSLVCPTLTTHDYQTLWTRLFAPPAERTACLCPLERFCASATSPSLYQLLSLKPPAPMHTASRMMRTNGLNHQVNNNHHHPVNNDNNQASTMVPLCQAQLELEQAMRPTLPQLLECWRHHQPPTFLVDFHLPQDNNDNDSNNDDWTSVQRVWHLYRTVFQNDMDVHDKALVLNALTSWSSHLDTAFHLVSHCGPALVDEEPA